LFDKLPVPEFTPSKSKAETEIYLGEKSIVKLILK